VLDFGSLVEGRQRCLKTFRISLQEVRRAKLL